MYIITMNENNQVAAIGKTIKNIDTRGFELVDDNTYYSNSSCSYFDVDESSIPAVTELELITKYYYTEVKGFYDNPYYVEPEPEKLYTLDEAAEVLAQEVSQNGYDA